MTRLIWKEIRSSVWLIMLAAAILALAVICKDPLWFHEDTGPSWFPVIILPFLLLGLKAYSDEMASGTVGFLFSMPVRWWKVWLSKLFFGIIAGVFLTLFVTVLHVAFLPALYKPVFFAGIPQGMLYFFLMFMCAYTAGFIVSILMPGIALSFAAIVGTWVLFAVMGIILSLIEEYLHATWLSNADWCLSLIIVLLSVLVANLLIARGIQKFTLRRRLFTWVASIAAGIFACMILAEAGVSTAPWQRSAYFAESFSPNGRWTVYWADSDPWEPGINKIRFVDTGTGKVFDGWSDSSRVCGWSPDSASYAALDDFGYGVHMASMTGASPKVTILRPPSRIRNPRRLSWSPDGKLFAVMSAVEDKASCTLTIVDIRQRKFTTKKAAIMSLEKAMASSGSGPVLARYAADDNDVLMIYWPPARTVCK